MTYVEHVPHPSLAPHVECYWTIRATVPRGARWRTQVLPDGCMDIIVPLGDPADTAHGGRSTPYVVGTMTRPLHVTHTGHVDLVGVRFRAGGAMPYLRVDAAALTDDAADLGDLWGGASVEVAERLDEARSVLERVEVLDRVLRARSVHSRATADEAVLRASRIATRAENAPASVEAMAEAAGLSRRQLERRFLASVGLTPRAALRVARLRRAVALLHAGPPRTLSEVAFRAGYADQPHLTRDFVALAGTTPGRYRRERTGV